MERHEITYGITGSPASSAYGENRFTNDIDVVVGLRSHTQLDQLLAEFPSDRFYVSDVAARTAVSAGGHFNIIDHESMQKVDVYVPGESNWPDQLERIVRLPIGGDREAWFLSPEDLILRKLHFLKREVSKSTFATLPACGRSAEVGSIGNTFRTGQSASDSTRSGSKSPGSNRVLARSTQFFLHFPHPSTLDRASHFLLSDGLEKPRGLKRLHSLSSSRKDPPMVKWER